VADPKLTPRKAPRQDRAKATVEAILIAGERLTRRDSLDAWTTNHVADLAGVSIGSLYQYFPSKEALVAALVSDHTDRMEAALTQSLAGPTAPTLEARARQLVRGVIVAYRVDAQLDHVLCQEVPKVGELQKVYGFEQHLAERCRTHLFTGTHVRQVDIDRAVFLLVNAVPGVVRAAVRENLSGENDERLADDLTDMIVRYLAVQPLS
jgi:AcrR family transcriptional regulator